MSNDNPAHIIPRQKFLDAYINSGVELLSNITTDSPELLRAFVQKQVEETYKPRTCTIIDNASYGNAELVDNVDVLKLFDHYNQYIYSPSGSFYYLIKIIGFYYYISALAFRLRIFCGSCISITPENFRSVI